MNLALAVATSATPAPVPHNGLQSWRCEASTLISVTLSWDPPSDTGGMPILGYKAWPRMAVLEFSRWECLLLFLCGIYKKRGSCHG